MAKFPNLNSYIDKAHNHKCVYDGGMIGPSRLIDGVDFLDLECVICGKRKEVLLTKRIENLIIMHNQMK